MTGTRWIGAGYVAVILAGCSFVGGLQGDFGAAPTGASACADGVKDGDESDVDCGGRCAPCALKQKCTAAKDCASGACVGGACVAPKCDDGVKNGAESDVDCGGMCAACKDGGDCKVGHDCASGACTMGKCAAPSCADGVKNGAESDVDCGGGKPCPPCEDGKACSSAADCLSGACDQGKHVCAPATCMDGLQNEGESDVDCGGMNCPTRCGSMKHCNDASDCADKVCTDGKCQDPNCGDKVKNGKETDVDCGGPPAGCNRCAYGKKCVSAADCDNKAACAANQCAPAPVGVWQQEKALSPAHSAAPLAYNAVTKRTLLFGGYSSCANAFSNDLLGYDGNAWTALVPPVPLPPKRYLSAMVFDTKRAKAVVFGGQDDNGNYLGDTWEWDSAANTWSKAAPKTSPAPRVYHAMAYDVANAVTVLFGGADISNYLGDTWLWDGTNWTQTSVMSGPPARHVHAMAYDGARKKTVLAGGTGLNGKLTDTWEWDGAAWQNAPNAVLPVTGSSSASFDSARARTVLVQNDGATYEWDGSVWLFTANGPYGSYGGMAYDPARTRTVRVVTVIGCTPNTETWGYYTLATPCNVGSDCGNGNCVDGLCCQAAACSGGQKCNTPGKPGFCN